MDLSQLDFSQVTEMEFGDDYFDSGRLESCVATLSKIRVVAHTFSEDYSPKCKVRVTFTPDEGDTEFQEEDVFYDVGGLYGHVQPYKDGGKLPKAFYPGLGLDDDGNPKPVDLDSEDPNDCEGYTILHIGGTNKTFWAKCPWAQLLDSFVAHGRVKGEIDKDLRKLEGTIRGRFELLPGKGKKWTDDKGVEHDPKEVLILTELLELQGSGSKPKASSKIKLSEGETEELQGILFTTIGDGEVLRAKLITTIFAYCKSDPDKKQRWSAFMKTEDHAEVLGLSYDESTKKYTVA